MATESTSAMFRGSEGMRKIQQHAAAAQKLRDPCQPAALLAIQSELLRLHMQGTGQYWQQLAAAAMQAQIETMTSVVHMLDSEAGGGAKSALEVFQTIIPPMANSFFVSRSNGSAEHRRAS